MEYSAIKKTATRKMAEIMYKKRYFLEECSS